MANDNLSEIIRRILHLETKVKRIENSSGNADLAKRVGVLEKAFATKPAAPAVKISTTTKPAPGKMIAKSADNSLAIKVSALRLLAMRGLK